ncbi:MAG TPA: hypothetical protein VFB59_00665 [Candidatus Saccharimonadales bacterium]|nr:hypothetical protein [Candidatus Saccharimonadales bacterium]
MNKETKPLQLTRQLHNIWESSLKLRILLFVVLVVALYGFIGIKIKSLGNVQPTQEEIASKADTTTRPNIDQDVVNQIKQLQDNSVTVQALFDQARQNPFRE